MQDPINTVPLQQFIQQVKAADLSQQREIRMDIKTAKSLAYCLAEINSRLIADYDTLLKKLEQNTGSTLTVSMDGGGFSAN